MNHVEEIRALRADVQSLTALVGVFVKTPPVSLLEPFTVDEFAQRVRRSPEWVSDRCRAGGIKTLPVGKPYLIPPTELMRLLTLSDRN